MADTYISKVVYMGLVLKYVCYLLKKEKWQYIFPKYFITFIDTHL